MTVLNARLPAATAVTATYSQANNVTEQTVFTFSLTSYLIGAGAVRIESIWLDMVNKQQASTIRVKHITDGATLRTFQTIQWSPGDDLNIEIDSFTAFSQIRVTVQSAIAEGAARDIPYGYVYRGLT